MIFESKQDDKKTLEEYELVKDGKLDFPESVWLEMLERFGRDALHQHISNLIDNLRFPYREYSEVQLRRDWQRLLTEEENFKEDRWEAKRVPSVKDFTYLGEYRLVRGSN